MVGAAEIELDKETGEVKVVDYAACVDCGTPINPNLTRGAGGAPPPQAGICAARPAAR